MVNYLPQPSALHIIKTDSVQSSSNTCKNFFSKNLLTARQLLECYLKHLIVIQFSFSRNLMSNFVRMLKASVNVFQLTRNVLFN